MCAVRGAPPPPTLDLPPPVGLPVVWHCGLPPSHVGYCGHYNSLRRLPQATLVRPTYFHSTHLPPPLRPPLADPYPFDISTPQRMLLYPGTHSQPQIPHPPLFVVPPHHPYLGAVLCTPPV
uniref:Uncharacterized protein C02F12.8 n=1 Tax=Lygus hesperus TaxID=30085 RepID=A0A0A9ZAE0_LYGHE